VRSSVATSRFSPAQVLANEIPHGRRAGAFGEPGCAVAHEATVDPETEPVPGTQPSTSIVLDLQLYFLLPPHLSLCFFLYVFGL